MASGSAMEQDSLHVGTCGDGATVLMPFPDFALGVQQEIEGKLMAGEASPEVSQHPHAIVTLKPGIWHGDE